MRVEWFENKNWDEVEVVRVGIIIKNVKIG